MTSNYNLENRLINFAILSIEFIGRLSTKPSNRHLGNQLLRSSTSVALNYGEAQSAESRRDFIHKCKVALKELRESIICLKIIKGTNTNLKEIDPMINETNELIAIFVKSIQTAQKNSV